jgi:hypothetical protein
MLSFARLAFLITACIGLSLTRPVSAAEPESCPGLIASREALFSWAALRQDQVGLTFVGHATSLIETPQGGGLPPTTATEPIRPSCRMWSP